MKTGLPRPKGDCHRDILIPCRPTAKFLSSPLQLPITPSTRTISSLRGHCEKQALMRGMIRRIRFSVAVGSSSNDSPRESKRLIAYTRGSNWVRMLIRRRGRWSSHTPRDSSGREGPLFMIATLRPILLIADPSNIVREYIVLILNNTTDQALLTHFSPLFSIYYFNTNRWKWWNGSPWSKACKECRTPLSLPSKSTGCTGTSTNPINSPPQNSSLDSDTKTTDIPHGLS
jgi:hypothetical protein